MRSHKQERMVPIETLPGHRIRISETNRLVTIDDVPLVCSVGEYRVLVLFLRSPDRVVPFTQLLGEGYDPEDQFARKSLRRVISRVRARLWPFGLDIRCLLGQGYLLFSLTNDCMS